MESRIQIVAILATAILFVVVFEAVRRRRLMERYALLWLFSAAVLLGLAVWKDALEEFASAVGIYYAPSALFAIALGFISMLLLHFSLVISRLADQTKVLAQRVSLLQARVDELEARRGAEAPAVAEERPHLVARR
ncbi:MAG TPA: DUF2304 domain-containing protein [Solirubrobacteraceae bacterium]|jgi:hypothetical protein